jgi:hypothetical protein
MNISFLCFPENTYAVKYIYHGQQKKKSHKMKRNNETFNQ